MTERLIFISLVRTIFPVNSIFVTVLFANANSSCASLATEVTDSLFSTYTFRLSFRAYTVRAPFSAYGVPSIVIIPYKIPIVIIFM
jgi:hypothetical protein